MKKKTLFIGLGILLLNIIGGVAAFSILNLTYMGYLLISTTVTLMLWFFLLKKELKLPIIKLNREVLKRTSLFSMVPFSIIIIILALFPFGAPSNILYLLVISLLIAIHEEVLFRGILQGVLIGSGFTSQRSILIASLLFAAAHIIFKGAFDIGGIYIFINSFIMGYLFGYVYLISRNILYVISLHFIWDYAIFLNQRVQNDDFALMITLALFTLSGFYFLWSYRNLKKRSILD